MRTSPWRDAAVARENWLNCPKAAQRGDRVAVITDVPALECSSCGETWYSEEVTVTLDGLLTEMLDRELVAVRRYPYPNDG